MGKGPLGTWSVVLMTDGLAERPQGHGYVRPTLQRPVPLTPSPRTQRLTVAAEWWSQGKGCGS